MYLVASVSGFYFGLPLKVVKKVLDINQIVRKDEEFFYEDSKVFLLDGYDFFRVTKGARSEKKSALLLSVKDTDIPALLVDEVIGFLNEDNAGILDKPGYLDLFGFGMVDCFSFAGDKLVLAVGEQNVERRLEERYWES